MARGMCGWSACPNESELTLTGEFGMGGMKARVAFCSLEHLLDWAVRRLALPAHGVGQKDEEIVRLEVDKLLSDLKRSYSPKEGQE